MPITINSNTASMNAQRKVSLSSDALRRGYERLSSGMRIVHASDDSAGLAIAKSLSADNRVYTQGIRNINDGVSYMNVAEGSITELKNIIFRCSELASQASNGTMTGTQRKALNAECQSLASEYNRILSTSEFNGRKIFDSTQGNVQVQFGYGDNESIASQMGTGPITTQTTRSSIANDGTQATGSSSGGVISGNGRYVAFLSSATNLVTGDTNGQSDIFVRDLTSGTTTRATLANDGSQANAGSLFGAISADGRYVSFRSTATNLVVGDTNGVADIFVRDLVNNTTTRVNVANDGSQSNAGSVSSNYSISADGRYVSFYSSASNLVAGDTNGQSDVFVRDLVARTTIRASVANDGSQGNASSNESALSADGRYIAFYSSATNLVSGDTNGAADVFVRDLIAGTTTRASLSSNGTQANGSGDTISISADGRYVAFRSDATNLVSGDTNGNYDTFVRDLLTGTTTRVNVADDGTQGDFGTSTSSISADGRYVAFDSFATNLVTGDTNGTTDIFVRDLISGKTTRVNLDSSGVESNNSSVAVFISADGRTVLYDSLATNLISGDTNGANDIFLSANTAISYAPGFSSSVTPLVGVSVATKFQALIAQGTLRNYLTELTTVSGQIGASQSRYSTVASTLSIRTENLSAAASQILDVDVAEESSHLVRNKILQQAGAEVLAQANQLPALALKLLAL